MPDDQYAGQKEFLDLLFHLRKNYVYGLKRDYFDDPNIVGWTLEGDLVHPDSGLAVIMSDNAGGSKAMNIGQNLAGCLLYDCTGHIQETVYIDQEGNGIFYVDGGSVSIWIKKEART